MISPCLAGHRWMIGSHYCAFKDATYLGPEDDDFGDDVL